MKLPIRALKRVKLKTIWHVLRHWRTSFSVLEKIIIVGLVLSVVLTSWRWTMAATQKIERVPNYGGTFIEGVTGTSLENIDLGRLTKAGLVRFDEANQVVGDLASGWEVSSDKLSYKFTLISKVTATEIVELIKKNPTYLPDVAPEIIDNQTITFKLPEAKSDFLDSVAKPLFPHGPYKVDKKTDTELRLIRNKDYHLEKPYIDKFIIRLYPDKEALTKAAKKNKVTAAYGVDEAPNGWQKQKVVLGQKHDLFINCSKPYLKKLSVRESILGAQKPEGVETLDLLEVNGNNVEPEYEALKTNLTQAGVKLNVRKVSLKDALVNDIPKRNYDLLYIMVNEGLSKDPYILWNSTQRSEDGQNFAELANADIDKLTEEYRTADEGKKAELLGKINELVQQEKVVIQYPNIQELYAVSPKVKGLIVQTTCPSDSDRFNFAAKWYMAEKRKK